MQIFRPILYEIFGGCVTVTGRWVNHFATLVTRKAYNEGLATTTRTAVSSQKLTFLSVVNFIEATRNRCVSHAKLHYTISLRVSVILNGRLNRQGGNYNCKNKAVINRRHRPRCCHLGSYFKRPKVVPCVRLPASGITAHSLLPNPRLLVHCASAGRRRRATLAYE